MKRRTKSDLQALARHLKRSVQLSKTRDTSLCHSRRLTAAITKTKQGRHIEISENCRAWLSPHAKEVGRVFPFSENVLRDRLVDLREKHNVPTIKTRPAPFVRFLLAGDARGHKPALPFPWPRRPADDLPALRQGRDEAGSAKVLGGHAEEGETSEGYCISAGGHGVKVDGFLSERSLFVHPLNEKGEEATPADCFRYASRWAWELWKLARHDKEAQKS